MFFHVEGYSILSVIDYGSRYLILKVLRSTTSAAVIDELDEIFSTFGLPEALVSDNGPQFVSAETAAFLSRLGIKHVRSSPRYARSNGMVERLHRVVKERLLALKPFLPFRKRLNQVLFDIRSSRHRMLGTAPSTALFSRQMRTRVPAHIAPCVVNPRHQLKAKAEMAQHHDSQRGVHRLPDLQPGTKVVVHDGYYDRSSPWTVVEQYGRQVGITDGSQYLLRNRQHVREFESPRRPVEPAELEMPAPGPSATRSKADSLPAVATARSGPQCEQSTGTSAPPVRSPTPTQDTCTTKPASPERKFVDGMVTRSGRQVKLTEKARLFADSLQA